MNKTSAKKITDAYFESWLSQDYDRFIGLLHPDIEVKECTGDTYLGIETAKKWFKGWHEGGNRVVTWPISDYMYDPESETMIATWIFTCLFDGVEYTFEGISTLSFGDGLIYRLSEYQMEAEKKYPYAD